ncbi:DUF2278 family protein [Kribbella sp. NPDC004536]|uniref:DUF2278 family protein n=1 Tax=Kribbella sp. NPDC004536 TaxID=3364106 RepID=UPI003682B518
MQYREVRRLDPQLFTSTAALPDGWHPLASTPTSGALDYIRSPLLRGSGGCLTVVYSPLFAWLNAILRSPRIGWVDSTADNALDLLDGGTIIHRSDGELTAFLTKFKPQSLTTDDDGLPV